jgi:hypothetical protein
VKKIFAIILLLTISGCGYTSKPFLSSRLETIYVDNFRNKIDITKETEYKEHYRLYRPGLERKATKETKERFIFDGTLEVVNDPDSADSLLECAIIDYRKEPLQYTDNKVVDEYRLKIIVSIKFTDLIENSVLVDEAEFAGEATYTLTGPLAGTESTAQDEALADLARRIVEKVVEGW